LIGEVKMPANKSKGNFPLIVIISGIILLTAAILLVPGLIKRQKIYSSIEAREISPLLVGTNLWNYPTPDVWEVCDNTGLRIIEYNINFPPTRQLERWVNQIKSIDAEPMVQISAYITPEKAAEVVHHFNVETKNYVKYWNIGNEPWIDARMTNDHLGLAEEVESYVKALASAMKAVDPEIQIFAPDEAFYIDAMYQALLGGENDITGKDSNGNYYIDGVSWHLYVGFPPENLQVEDLTTLGVERFRSTMEKVSNRVDYANQIQGREGDDALQWGIGEMNSSTGSRVNTFENGQMIAQIYGLAMEYGAQYACTWSMFESMGSGGTTDFSLMDYKLRPRPHFYHMQMISQYFNGLYIKTHSNDTGIRSFAALEGNRLSVMLMNIETSGEQHCNINFDDSYNSLSGTTVLVPAGIPAQDFETIKGQSTLVLVYNLSGKLLERISYSKEDHWAEKLPPRVETY
jgi:hypothetical protein